MADTRISALPAVAVPAVGDEFACNQAGVTKKETKAQITAATDANLAAHIAVTAAGIHGSATATGANTLLHRDAAGDADATAFNAGAGAAGTPSHTFTADLNTGLYNPNANELGISTNGARRGVWNATGALILGDATASSQMTGPGVTIQQGAYDDEAVALQSTDVAHGMTNEADTDTYGADRKVQATAGGRQVLGLKDADGYAGGALELAGYLGDDADTTKTAASHAIVEVYGGIRDAGTPTQIGNTNADGNVFAVRTHRGGGHVTLLIVDEDGDLHVLNDIVVAGVVDGVDVAAHVAAAVLDHPNDSVTDAKLRNSAARSVIGRAAAAGGDPADIVAGADNQVLARTAGTLAFQPVVPAMITDRTRKFFVPCVGGWDSTGAGEMLVRDDLRGWNLVDGATCAAFGSFMVPSDFVSDMIVTPVAIAAALGNIRCSGDHHYGQCGEAQDNHTDFVAIATIALVNNLLECIQPTALSNESIGDIVNVTFVRAGGDVLDTIGTVVYFPGWIVEYTADS